MNQDIHVNSKNKLKDIDISKHGKRKIIETFSGDMSPDELLRNIVTHSLRIGVNFNEQKRE